MYKDACKKELECDYNWAEEPSHVPGACTHDKIFWGDKQKVEFCKTL